MVRYFDPEDGSGGGDEAKPKSNIGKYIGIGVAALAVGVGIGYLQTKSKVDALNKTVQTEGARYRSVIDSIGAERSSEAQSYRKNIDSLSEINNSEFRRSDSLRGEVNSLTSRSYSLEKRTGELQFSLDSSRTAAEESAKSYGKLESLFEERGRSIDSLNNELKFYSNLLRTGGLDSAKSQIYGLIGEKMDQWGKQYDESNVKRRGIGSILGNDGHSTRRFTKNGNLSADGREYIDGLLSKIPGLKAKVDSLPMAFYRARDNIEALRLVGEDVLDASKLLFLEYLKTDERYVYFKGGQTHMQALVAKGEEGTKFINSLK